LLARLGGVAEPPLDVRDDDGDGEGEEIIAARLASLAAPPPPDQDGARDLGREGKGRAGGERTGGTLVEWWCWWWWKEGRKEAEGIG
jgi:hypothetical protein